MVTTARLARFKREHEGYEARRKGIIVLLTENETLVSMFIELSHYAKFGAGIRKGPGVRAFNQLIDEFIELGYEEDLEKEDKNHNRYLTHPEWGPWVGGKFEKERFYKDGKYK